MSLIYIFECIENEDQTVQPYNKMFSANRGFKSHPLKVKSGLEKNDRSYYIAFWYLLFIHL